MTWRIEQYDRTGQFRVCTGKADRRGTVWGYYDTRDEAQEVADWINNRPDVPAAVPSKREFRRMH